MRNLSLSLVLSPPSLGHWNFPCRLEFSSFTMLSLGVRLFHSLFWPVGISFPSVESYLLPLSNYIALFLWQLLLLYFCLFEPHISWMLDFANWLFISLIFRTLFTFYSYFILYSVYFLKLHLLILLLCIPHFLKSLERCIIWLKVLLVLFQIQPSCYDQSVLSLEGIFLVKREIYRCLV